MSDSVLGIVIVAILFIFVHLIDRSILRSNRMRNLAKLMNLKYIGGFKLFTLKNPGNKRHIIFGKYRDKNIEMYDQLLQGYFGGTLGGGGNYQRLVIRIDHKNIPMKYSLFNTRVSGIKRLVDNYIDKLY